MNHTRKLGNISAVVAALQSAGAWPVASTSQIYEAARAHGFSYGSAIEVFMFNKTGRGQWDVSTVSDSTTNQPQPQVIITSEPDKSNDVAFDKGDRLKMIARIARRHEAEQNLQKSLETNINDEFDEYERVINEEFSKVSSAIFCECLHDD